MRLRGDAYLHIAVYAARDLRRLRDRPSLMHEMTGVAVIAAERISALFVFVIYFYTP